MTTDTTPLPVPVITRPEQGATVPNRVKAEGKAQPGAIVVIAKAVTFNEYLKVTADLKGAWTGVFYADLIKGKHEIVARQLVDNVYSDWSPKRVFEVV